jgi:hypothetical protein
LCDTWTIKVKVLLWVIVWRDCGKHEKFVRIVFLQDNTKINLREIGSEVIQLIQ